MDKIRLSVDKKRKVKMIIGECLEHTSCFQWALFNDFVHMDMFSATEDNIRHWVRVEIRKGYVRIFRQQQELVDTNAYRDIGRREIIEVATRIQRKYYMDILASITADVNHCESIGYEFIRSNNIVYKRNGYWVNLYHHVDNFQLKHQA